MDNVTFITVENLNGTSEHAIIEHAPGEFISMTKAAYERQQAEQSTPNLAD